MKKKYVCASDSLRPGQLDRLGRSGQVDAQVSCELLKKYGFVKNDKTIYAKRIHEKIHIEFDTNDNFAQLVRFEEIVKHNYNKVKIIIPKKISYESDLINLLNAISN